VLAGQTELGRRLEDPARAALFQRIGVYCKVEGLDSPETLRDYVMYRLECAGAGDRKVFTMAAIRALWRYSENGVPRLVNKLCKLSLKAGQTGKLETIDEDVVDAVAARFMRTVQHEADR
jgi:type II secretory pathway predicted ATPase ExeA